MHLSSAMVRRYHLHADASVEKLGIQFNGLAMGAPPQALTVKSVTALSFGELRGIEEGDKLLKLGSQELKALEDRELGPLGLDFHAVWSRFRW